MQRNFIGALTLAVGLAFGVSGCSDTADGPIRLYTSVTDDTVTAVVDQFTAETGLDVDVFRAPTGELAARIAAEHREGGIQADVLWLTDPLTMQQYASDGLLSSWDPAGSDAVAPEYKTATSWGTRILSMVIVQHADHAPLDSWDDLADVTVAGRVAAPDPGFAGSAFAVLGYFAAEPDFGLDFYRRLRDNGLTVVSAPGEVVTGVAEGRFDTGITLDFSAQAALDKGSPISIVWPEPGAIALYSPIAVVETSGAAAEAFVEHVLSKDAQQVIADTGWQPIRADVPWDVGGPQVSVDWSAIFEQRQQLLNAYEALFDE